jgi:hypothetical protein
VNVADQQERSIDTVSPEHPSEPVPSRIEPTIAAMACTYSFGGASARHHASNGTDRRRRYPRRVRECNWVHPQERLEPYNTDMNIRNGASVTARRNRPFEIMPRVRMRWGLSSRLPRDGVMIPARSFARRSRTSRPSPACWLTTAAPSHACPTATSVPRLDRTGRVDWPSPQCDPICVSHPSEIGYARRKVLF